MPIPLVSIITPVYNCEQFISEAVRSVNHQTYPNWEHLIVDDSSTDRSWEIITSLARYDQRIKPFRLEKNSGSGVARNLATQNASGKYIAFLDGDDVWLPERLEKHIGFMTKGGYAFSHSSYGYMKEDGTILSKQYHVSSKPVSYRKLLRKTDISCLTAIYDQEQIGKFFMPDLRRKQDYGMWLSILKSGIKSIPYDEVLAYYRQRKGSATNKKSKLILQHYHFLRRHEKLNAISSFKYTFYWGLGGIFKYIL